jgi:perosamine synthetase
VRGYFTFVVGHTYLTDSDFNSFERLVDLEDSGIVEEYEEKFSKLVGEGHCVSFASGRMGFYTILKYLEIMPGDEVILLGSTCSVMADAVLRSGATPVYSDIDVDTFGSDPGDILKKINSKTRLIVAQHSFGIPCDIESISAIAKSRRIILVEDCALAIGSKVKGKPVGSFGDFSIFSTDHTKPINTIIGGMVFSENFNTIASLRKLRDAFPELSDEHKLQLLRQIRLEKFFFRPKLASLFPLFAYVNRIQNLVSRNSLPSPFLGESESGQAFFEYPYPSKMPSFLSKLGIWEIENWENTRERSVLALKKFIQDMELNAKESVLPRAYFNPDLEIVPLRVVWSQSSRDNARQVISKRIDVEGIWFLSPIIATSLPLERFGYTWGSCPISESIGPRMINIPCDFILSKYYKNGIRKILSNTYLVSES